jgi:hypothetical protein
VCLLQDKSVMQYVSGFLDILLTDAAAMAANQPDPFAQLGEITRACAFYMPSLRPGHVKHTMSASRRRTGWSQVLFCCCITHGLF